MEKDDNAIQPKVTSVNHQNLPVFSETNLVTLPYPHTYHINLLLHFHKKKIKLTSFIKNYDNLKKTFK